MKRRFQAAGVPALALGAGLCGCAGPAEVWDASPDLAAAVALADAAVLVDPGAERALVLSALPDAALASTSLPIGRGFANIAVTPDASAALVLSRGDVPLREAGDQGPTLSVLRGGASPAASVYPLSAPLAGLAVDPIGRYAVVTAAGDDPSFVTNPNELIVVDLEQSAGTTNPTPVTLRSFGGAPERFTFTPELELPGESTRLLVVETDRDVGLLDLGDLAAGDITIRLSSASSGAVRAPAQVVVTDGDVGRDDDARVAVRLANEPSVVFLDLLPSAPGSGGRAFSPTPNEVFVGGVPTDVAFVSTDAGARLAAMVPERSALVLADPVTGITTEVALGSPYEHLAVVTAASGAPTGAGTGDVALLWSSGVAKVAFVELGSAVGTPYRSVEELALEAPVTVIHDVPAPNARKKVLALEGGFAFAVLDLVARTQAPIHASAGSSVMVAPDGLRAWLTSSGGFGAGAGADIAALDLATLHPENILLEDPISQIFDVRRQGGGRALLAVHPVGAVAITVLDAESPSLEGAREYVGVLLGGLP